MATTVPALERPTSEILSIEQIREAVAQSEKIALADPVMARSEFQIRRVFYPLGFPLELSTNSDAIVELASDLWGGFRGEFDIPPMQLEVGVTEGPGCACPPSPKSHTRRHVCSIIADSENFSISDLATGFTHVWTTEGALAYPNYVRYFLLESSALTHIAARFSAPIHAACVVLNDCGILLCGDSGAGKSTLSYACARAGWTFVSDDGSFLVNGREDGLVVGNCALFRFRPSAEELFPELHGRQIIQRAAFGKPSIEVPSAFAEGLTTASTSTVRHIVFLNRSRGKRQELIHFPTEVARHFMLQRMSTIPEFLREQEVVMDRLLARGAFELCYTDFNWAIDRLSQLAQEGR